jgi:glycosyltransferase involved in cell wall biosynthesis
VGETPVATDFRSQGDAARDAADWPAAAAAYRRHLEIAPDDGDIWVQYGHALKEAGDAAGATEAYRCASRLPESEAEGLFQLGLSLRKDGRGEEATLALEKALELSPRFDIHQALGEDAPIPRPLTGLGRRTLVLDVTDLLSFLIAHGFPTGIQRVQLGLMAAVLRSDASVWPYFEAVHFTFAEHGRPWRLKTADLFAILRYVEEETVDVTEARRLTYQAKRGGVCTTWSAGSAYLVLGAFWADGGLGPLQRFVGARGAVFGVLVHDLFAVTMPELCQEGAVETFEAQLRAGLQTWDFVVTNSEATAKDVRRYLAERLPGRAVPVIATALAHDFATRPRESRAPTAAPLPEAVRDRRFVLSVGTIEPRKNYPALLDAWSALARRRADLPQLVIVGRPGWRSDTVVEQLRRGAAPGVLWLEDMSDAQLDALYRGCLFTVFPSLAEGWGLPIGEALVRGKVCVASASSAMPEASGGLAVHFDPDDNQSLEKAIETLLYDPAALAACEAKIRTGFRARTWIDVARAVMTGVAAVVVGSSRPAGG